MNVRLLLLASTATAAASSAAIFIGWWSLPIRYVARMPSGFVYV